MIVGFLPSQLANSMPEPWFRVVTELWLACAVHCSSGSSRNPTPRSPFNQRKVARPHPREGPAFGDRCPLPCCRTGEGFRRSIRMYNYTLFCSDRLHLSRIPSRSPASFPPCAMPSFASNPCGNPEAISVGSCGIRNSSNHVKSHGALQVQHVGHTTLACCPTGLSRWIPMPEFGGFHSFLFGGARVGGRMRQDRIGRRDRPQGDSQNASPECYSRGLTAPQWIGSK